MQKAITLAILFTLLTACTPTEFEPATIPVEQVSTLCEEASYPGTLEVWDDDALVEVSGILIFQGENSYPSFLATEFLEGCDMDHAVLDSSAMPILPEMHFDSGYGCYLRDEVEEFFELETVIEEEYNELADMEVLRMFVYPEDFDATLVFYNQDRENPDCLKAEIVRGRVDEFLQYLATCYKKQVVIDTYGDAEYRISTLTQEVEGESPVVWEMVEVFPSTNRGFIISRPIDSEDTCWEYYPLPFPFEANK